MRSLVSCPEVVCAFKSRAFLGLAVAIGKLTPVKLSVVLDQTHASVEGFRRGFPLMFSCVVIIVLNTLSPGV